MITLLSTDLFICISGGSKCLCVASADFKTNTPPLNIDNSSPNIISSHRYIDVGFPLSRLSQAECRKTCCSNPEILAWWYTGDDTLLDVGAQYCKPLLTGCTII